MLFFGQAHHITNSGLKVFRNTKPDFTEAFRSPHLQHSDCCNYTFVFLVFRITTGDLWNTFSKLHYRNIICLVWFVYLWMDYFAKRTALQSNICKQLPVRLTIRRWFIRGWSCIIKWNCIQRARTRFSIGYRLGNVLEGEIVCIDDEGGIGIYQLRYQYLGNVKYWRMMSNTSSRCNTNFYKVFSLLLFSRLAENPIRHVHQLGVRRIASALILPVILSNYVECVSLDLATLLIFKFY